MVSILPAGHWRNTRSRTAFGEAGAVAVFRASGPPLTTWDHAKLALPAMAKKAKTLRIHPPRSNAPSISHSGAPTPQACSGRAHAQSHSSCVHTAAGVPDAPEMLKSMKLPGATATAPTEEQLPPLVAAQLKVVSAIAAAGPFRSLTVTVLDCKENTSSRTAEQPRGTHARTLATSPNTATGALTA